MLSACHLFEAYKKENTNWVFVVVVVVFARTVLFFLGEFEKEWFDMDVEKNMKTYTFHGILFIWMFVRFMMRTISSNVFSERDYVCIYFHEYAQFDEC